MLLARVLRAGVLLARVFARSALSRRRERVLFHGNETGTSVYRKWREIRRKKDRYDFFFKENTLFMRFKCIWKIVRFCQKTGNRSVVG